MWSLKFLSGPKAGKEILLQEGSVVIGREASCQIHLPMNGISKKHAQILVKGNSLTIKDLKSRNGIFIKGKQILDQELKTGDRVALYNVVFEVKKKAVQTAPMNWSAYYPQNLPDQDLGFSKEDKSLQNNLLDAKAPFFQNLQKLVGNYIHEVILPGIYKLAEWIEFKWVIGFFVIGFILIVTAFSSIPLVSILKSSVEQESRHNAENIAITLAKINKETLKKGLRSASRVDYALRRPGVKKAFIIQAIDGRIIAPAELSDTYPKEPLIHKARKQDRNTVTRINKSSLLAVVPIRFYKAETGESIPRAYSVVIYDMTSLFVGASKVISLLTQNLLIACIIGFILFFFLINLIEFPIRSINNQMNRALKEENAPSISINYQSKILRDLCSSINSALNQISLNRMLNNKVSNEKEQMNRQNEMNNLVEIIGFPSLSIDIGGDTVAAINSNFAEQLGFSEILHSPVSQISDNFLKDHLLTLMEQGKANPQEITFGEINLNQIQLQSTCQFVMGKENPAYAIITFMSSDEEGAA